MSEQQLEIESEEAFDTALSEDQSSFLNALEAEEQEADIDPEQIKADEKQEEQQAAMNEQTAQLTAVTGLGMIEFTLKRVVHKEFAFTPETKEYAVENLGPVLIKYGALLPEWLAAYDAEIKAAMAAGKLISEGIETAQNLKALDNKAERKEPTQNQSNASQEAYSYWTCPSCGGTDLECDGDCEVPQKQRVRVAA